MNLDEITKQEFEKKIEEGKKTFRKLYVQKIHKDPNARLRCIMKFRGNTSKRFEVAENFIEEYLQSSKIKTKYFILSDGTIKKLPIRSENENIDSSEGKVDISRNWDVLSNFYQFLNPDKNLDIEGSYDIPNRFSINFKYGGNDLISHDGQNLYLENVRNRFISKSPENIRPLVRSHYNNLSKNI